MIVSFEDCYRSLVLPGGASCREIYREWETRRGYEQVVDFVKSLSHEHLFAVTPEDVDKVIDTRDHALGDIEATEQIRDIEDFTCPFAFEHLFHRFIERTGKVPTWQQSHAYIRVLRATK